MVRLKRILPQFDAHGSARCSSECPLYGDEKVTEHVGSRLTLAMCFTNDKLTIPGGTLCGPYQDGHSRAKDVRNA